MVALMAAPLAVHIQATETQCEEASREYGKKLTGGGAAMAVAGKLSDRRSPLDTRLRRLRSSSGRCTGALGAGVGVPQLDSSGRLEVVICTVPLL